MYVDTFHFLLYALTQKKAYLSALELCIAKMRFLKDVHRRERLTACKLVYVLLAQAQYLLTTQTIVHNRIRFLNRYLGYLHKV